MDFWEARGPPEASEPPPAKLQLQVWRGQGLVGMVARGVGENGLMIRWLTIDNGYLRCLTIDKGYSYESPVGKYVLDIVG